MSLKESLAKPVTSKRGPLCLIAQIRNGLDDAERQALDEAIATIRQHRDAGNTNGQSGYNAAWLHRALLDEGFTLSVLTVQKHVSQRCACGF